MSVQVLRTRNSVHVTLEVQVGRAEMNDCVIRVDARKKCLSKFETLLSTSINR